ncbi:MAG TPA: DNA polymerase III subunit gamma/tau [Synergistales bacterium]|nr:DNA polymerase III subunit gamma/tau [Synergistales bacterium]
MHLSLYRRHRPGVFSEVVAQDAAVSLLRREIAGGKNSHAYLFSGPRGCGKTTLARIVAKALNCPNRSEEGEPCAKCSQCISIASGDNLDVIEIDGASNRGIDEIRELKEHISLSPFSGMYKVYIIDEVHMLTDPAFNALLKTLEEPPRTVVFILATTEPHKVPATIRSRCQHIPFHRIPVPAIVECMGKVSALEGAVIEQEALWEMARESDGSLRDALSLLEQAVTSGLPTVSLEDIRGILGGGGRSDLERLVPAMRNGSAEVFRGFSELLQRGLTAERFLEGLFLLFRDILVAVLWGEEGIRSLPLSEEERAFIREESRHWREPELWKVLNFCSATIPRARYGLKAEVVLGMVLGLFVLSPAKTEERVQAKVASDLNEGVILAKGRAQKTEQKPEQKPEQEEYEVSSPGNKEVSQGSAPAAAVSSGGNWEECVDAMASDNLPLYCACVTTRAERDGDSLVVLFPEDRQFSFEIAASPRSLAYLDSIRLDCFPGVQMKLVCGDRSIQVAGNFPAGKDPQSEEQDGSPTSLHSSGEAPSGKSPPSERVRGKHIEAEDGENPQECFLEIQKFFNADLLVLKEENSDEPDTPEGAVAE